MRELKEIAHKLTTCTSALNVWLDEHENDEHVDEIDKKMVHDTIASLSVHTLCLNVLDMSMNAKKENKEQKEKLKKNEEDKESDEKKDEPEEALNMSFEGWLKILNGGT